MRRRASPALIALTSAALLGCGGDGGTASPPRTPAELIRNAWQVGAATVGEVTLRGAPGAPPPGFEAVRLRFDETTYTFGFPGGFCDLPDGVHEISGPWRLEQNDTRLVLDRSTATVGVTEDFVWDVLELGFGHLRTRYSAPSPLLNCTHVDFDITWVVE